ncbi:hypothetical protein EN918_24485, partial [Mesorhizobium sp. M7A.F.Ca.CA.004.05.1.1]
MKKARTDNLLTAIKSPGHALSMKDPAHVEIFPDYIINKRHMVAAAVVAVPLLFGFTGLAIRYAAVASTLAEPGFESYARALCRWDCHWYLDISERGYERFPIPNQSNVGRWGFFPFYPMLVAVIRAIFPFATILVATITSIACSYAACLVAWPLLEN